MAIARRRSYQKQGRASRAGFKATKTDFCPSGQARSDITAINTISGLLLDNYGAFLPRQGHAYAEQMKEAAAQIERFGKI